MAPNTLQSAWGGGNQRTASEDPLSLFFSLLPSAFVPPLAATEGFSPLVMRARSLSEVLGAAEAAPYAPPPGTQGTYQSNWGGLTDDHLLTM